MRRGRGEARGQGSASAGSLSARGSGGKGGGSRAEARLQAESPTPPAALAAGHVDEVLLVFETVVIQELTVENERLVDGDGPGHGVALGIVDRDFNLEEPESGPRDPLGHLAGAVQGI